MKQAVHFGAGNIGRGFIGDLLHESDYHIIFIDINKELVDELNKTHSYDLYLIDHDYTKKVINNVSALTMDDVKNIIKAIVNADVITTSVWANNLVKIAPIVAQGLKARLLEKKPKINIIACENAMFATKILKQAMIETKILNNVEFDNVAAYPSTAVDRVVIGGFKDNRPAVNIADYYELAIEQNNLVNIQELPIEHAKYTDNLQKFLQRKLYIINCGHAWAGYAGYINGYKNVRDVFLNPVFEKQIKEVMTESAKFIEAKYDFSHEEMVEYVKFGIKRYQAKGVDYAVSMVTRSPIRKLGANDRMVGPCVECEKRHFPNEMLLKGIAMILLLNNQDSEAIELQNYIKQNSVEKALEYYTTIKANSRMGKIILKYYAEQKIIRDSKQN